MLAISPVPFEGVLRNWKIDEGDEDTDRDFCPNIPSLTIVGESNYVKTKPSNETARE